MEELSERNIPTKVYDVKALEKLQIDLEQKETCPVFQAGHHNHRRRKRSVHENDHGTDENDHDSNENEDKHNEHETNEDEHHNEQSKEGEEDHHDEHQDEHGHGDDHDEPGIGKDDLYLRNQLIPLGRYYPSYFIWAQDIARILKIFDRTVLLCPHHVNNGIYQAGSRFFFMAHQSNIYNETWHDSILKSSQYFRRHLQTAIIVESTKTTIGFELFHQNIFSDNLEVINGAKWTPDKPILHKNNMFINPFNYQGLLLFHCVKCLK